MSIIDSIIGAISPTWALNRMLAREMMASYNGAVATRHDTAWEILSGNPIVGNSGLAYGKLKLMRDRARALCQNNAIASGMIERSVTNILGANGFGLHVTTDDPEWNKRAQDLFLGWFDQADILGNTWYEHIGLALTHYLRDGDFGSVLLSDGRLQPIPPELIETPFGKIGDPYCVDGVSVDPVGRPLTYWVTVYDGYTRKTTSRDIDAKDFVFVSRKKTLNQTRGEPCFATAFTTFDQIDQVQQAVLHAWKIQAYFAIVLKQKEAAMLQQRFPRKGTTAPGANAANSGPQPQPRQFKLESGTAKILQPGEEVGVVESSQPTQQFPENFKLNVQTLGLELGLPIELLLLDFKGTNYSSARAALLQAYASFRRIQKIFVDRYLARIYRWRVSKFMKSGQLPRRDDAFKHRWIPTPFPYLDPSKEIQAIQQGIDIGIDTLTSALLSVGGDFETWLETRKSELAKMKAAGIPQYHTAAVQELKGESSSATPTPPADDKEEDLNNEDA